LTELGNRLREAREAKGLSLDELQRITKIQKRYLIGIEDGNYSIMPGKFYVRAFIKQYAEAVDLNPEEIFDLYKEDVPAVLNTELPELSRVKSRKTISEGNSKVLDALPKLLIAVFLVGAAALIYYFLQHNAGDNTTGVDNTDNVQVKYDSGNLVTKKEEQAKNSTENEKDKTNSQTKDTNNAGDETTTEEEPVEESEPTQELSVVSSSGSETIYELKNTERFELKLVSTGETWVNMKNGKGFSHFQGMLKKGATESHSVDYTNETEAVLVIGNSVNTDIFINDQKLEYAIAPNDEVRQDIIIRFIRTAE
jgi:cytoskeletal protein RodZ